MGQVVEQWTSTGDVGNPGTWSVIETCGDGATCQVHDVTATSFAATEAAFCAAPAAECDPPNGRRCADATHMFTCIDGERIVGTTTIRVPDACPTASPYCIEPEPGLAFCVGDPSPSPDCANQVSGPVEVCTLQDAACTNADLALVCVDDVRLACLDGIVVDRRACGPGSCSTDVEDLGVDPCE